MSSINYSAVRKQLETAKSIVITTHKSPDGDAIGSSLGLYHFIKQINPHVEVIVPDDFPQFLKWMPDSNSVLIFDQATDSAKAKLANADVIFSLDYNALHRCGGIGPEIEKNTNAFKIMIDHHQQPESYPNITISNTAICSTAQLVYDFIVDLGGEQLLNKAIAACLYTGLMTDSGSFRFPSVDSHTHFIVGKLMETGFHPSEAHGNVYDNNSFNRLKLLGFALNKLELLNNNRAAIIALTRDELNAHHYQKGDTEGIVNYPLSIGTVQVSCFITEQEHEIKFSFRSKGTHDVNQLARARFGGGGHINAAGGRLECTLSEAIELAKQQLNEFEF